MPKIKLTKSELKRQKEGLKRFRRYLPMLQLKKKQVQLEIGKVYRQIKKLSQKLSSLRKEVHLWVDLFAQDLGLADHLCIKEIKLKSGNIAGIDIPIFSQVLFTESPYDPMLSPLWVDKGLEALKKTIELRAHLALLHQQRDILKEELRIIAQRVNLFEKIKIPQAQENIRVIRIYLGDLQTAEVVRGKLAKAKLERKKQLQPA